MNKRSCYRATEQMSRALDGPLGTLESMKLKLHLMMCDNCALCQEQLQELHRIAEKRADMDVKGR